MPENYFIGVDVGTSSARAALVKSNGHIIQKITHPIRTWNPQQEHYEQSSQDIWGAVCYCVRYVSSNVNKEKILAISFDATCSLVILDANGKPLTVSNTKNPQQNVILWMDHRARLESEQINAGKYDILKYVGGQVSVEMELPKLKWLKSHLFKTTWCKMWRAFDLADFLTWRCTDCDARSLCTVTCKWNYDSVLMQWNADFLHAIGLSDLLKNNAEVIGQYIQEVGTPVGKGLSERAAKEMNLLPGTVVSSGLIDANAGALAMFGCHPAFPPSSLNSDADICGKMALICGSSTCHLSLTREPCWTKGIWGPYRSVILKDFYLNEGGQSATGLLLDHIIKTHPHYVQTVTSLSSEQNIYSYLNQKLKQMSRERQLEDVCFLTTNLHIYPDFHGNRSPLADPNLRGMITGLNMTVDENSLAVLYLAALQSLAYSTRHIMETLVNQGRKPFHTLLFCGGLGKNELYVQCHADICQLPCLIPNEQDMVLVGAAMLGACAANIYDSLESTSYAMSGCGELLKPQIHTQQYHNLKYQVFLEMLQDQRKYKNMMIQ